MRSRSTRAARTEAAQPAARIYGLGGRARPDGGQSRAKHGQVRDDAAKRHDLLVPWPDRPAPDAPCGRWCVADQLSSRTPASASSGIQRVSYSPVSSTTRRGASGGARTARRPVAGTRRERARLQPRVGRPHRREAGAHRLPERAAGNRCGRNPLHERKRRADGRGRTRTLGKRTAHVRLERRRAGQRTADPSGSRAVELTLRRRTRKGPRRRAPDSRPPRRSRYVAIRA